MKTRTGMSGVLAVVVALMVVMAGTNGVDAQGPVYQCWGGCYNECFLRSTKTQPERLQCYYQCLNSCVPRTAADYQYYCQIGCSMERCIPVSSDGANLERCFGQCSDACKTP